MRRKVPWRPGARDLLAELRVENVPCALVTMSWRRLVDAIVSELPRGSFAATVVGDEVRRGKPHPEPYLAAARALKVSARDCVALEDSPTGVRSATAAGCQRDRDPAHRRRAEQPRSSRGRLVDRPARRQPARWEVRDRCEVPSALSRPAGRRGPVGGRGVGAVAIGNDPAPPPPVDIPIDAWVPYFALPDAEATLVTQGRFVRQVSPVWYSAQGPTTITVDEHLSPEATAQFIVGRARRRREGRAVDRRCHARGWDGRGAGGSRVSRRACQRHRRSGGHERLRWHRHRLRAVCVCRRPVDLGHDTSAVDRLRQRARPHVCMRTVARCRSACRTSKMANARTTAATGCTTTRRCHRTSTRSESWRTTTPPTRPARLLRCRSSDRRSPLRRRRSTTTASWCWALRCTDTTGRSLRLALARPIKKVRPA